MGRTIIAEEYVQECLNKIYANSGFQSGVIVGQLTLQKDYVLHLARTPPDSDEKPSQSLNDFNETWFNKHAKQVESMLPGGLRVIGVFVYASPDVFQANSHKMRQIVFSMYRHLAKNSLANSDNEAITERLALQICSLSKKLTCKTFDCADNNATAQPADWKLSTFVDGWVSLSTQFALDIPVTVTNEMGSKSLKRQIQTGLRSTCDRILQAKALLNGRYYSDDDVIDTSQHGGGGGGKKKGRAQREEIEQQHYDVTFLVQYPPTIEAGDHVTEPCCAKMHMRGSVACRAYAPAKCTAKQAIKLLKTDCVRTLTKRCDLLCEDLLVEEEEQDLKVLYETPRRVLTSLPGSRSHMTVYLKVLYETPRRVLTSLPGSRSHVTVCDYVFMDETARESVARFGEFLDIGVAEEEIDMEVESLPEEADLKKPGVFETETETSASEVSLASKQQSSVKYIGVVLGGAVAVLASALTYMYLSDTIP